MASFNKVILIGNVTRDPELRYTPKGTAVCKIGLAVNRTWRNEAGETKEEVTFVDVDAFGRSAETLAQYMKKGSPLMVEGRLKLDQWDDKQSGQKRSRLGVVVEGFQFLGGGQKASDAPRRRSGAEAEKTAEGQGDEPALTRSTESHGPPPEEDDVPF